MEQLRHDVANFWPKYHSDTEIMSLIDRIWAQARQYILLPERSKVSIKLSSRLSRKAGTFTWFVKSPSGEYSMCIRLSRPLLLEKEVPFHRCLSSLLHEALHCSNLINYIYNLENLEAHGPHFHEKAVLLNNVFRPEIPVTKYHDYEVSHRYVLECKKCTEIIRRVVKPGKLVKNIHKSCNGELVYRKIGNFHLPYSHSPSSSSSLSSPLSKFASSSSFLLLALLAAISKYFHSHYS